MISNRSPRRPERAGLDRKVHFDFRLFRGAIHRNRTGSSWSREGGNVGKRRQVVGMNAAESGKRASSQPSDDSHHRKHPAETIGSLHKKAPVNGLARMDVVSSRVTCPDQGCPAAPRKHSKHCGTITYPKIKPRDGGEAGRACPDHPEGRQSARAPPSRKVRRCLRRSHR